MAFSSARVTATDMERNPGKFSSLYEKGKLLGVGVCSKVYEGHRRSDGREVATKHMIKRPDSKTFVSIPGHDKPLLTEVAINLLLHKPVKCPNIVEMLDWFVEDGKYILIMEHPHPCMTLDKFLRSHRACLKETEALHLMRQAVNAAKHCIDHNVNHGDLHKQNVLVNTRTMELKLIDFGFSHLIPETPCKERTKGLSKMVLFLGRLLFAMTAKDKEHCFRGPDALDKPAIKALGLSKECLELINRSKFAPEADRPTFEEFLDHEWFKQG